MPTPTALLDTVSTQVLDAVKRSHDETVKAVAGWTDSVEGYLPETITSFDLVEKAPRPAALVEMAFDFAEKVIAYQFELARSVTGLIDNALDRKPAPAKPAASKATNGAKATKATADTK